MANAEIPHSVVVAQKLDPDKHSLARAHGNVKVIEPKGQIIRKAYEPTSRELILQSTENGKAETFVVFRPAEDLDSVIFFTRGEKTTKYAARNGIYVELGALNKDGQASVRFDLDTGNKIEASIDQQAFPYFETSLSIPSFGIELISKVCLEMKKNHLTPSPTNLDNLHQLLNNNIQTSPKPEQSAQLAFALPPQL